ncbi:MAG: MBL fold metallo-hydrolase [Thermodesulfobacteriota bacterium]
MNDSTPSETISAETPGYNIAVCVLASGSKGNAVYISNGETSILLDAGLSGIEIERRLKSRGLSPQSLDAIIVSHEHNDHVQGVGILSRRFGLPVYMNRQTGRAAVPLVGDIKDQQFFECGSAFRIKTLTIQPFSVSHDARDPAGFTVQQNGTKIGIATDLGIATAMVKEHLKNCHLMIIEANHDPDMLLQGPYPWPLKQRIKSRSGHLSNSETRHLLQELKHDGLEHVILAHLSEINNTPQKALSEVGLAFSNCRARLTVAAQDDCGSLYRLT